MTTVDSGTGTGTGTDSGTATAASVRFFEDFRVGQCFTSKKREVTAADLADFTRISGDAHPLHADPAYAATTRFGAPVLQGPFGVAVFFGLFHELGLATESIVALLDTNWRYLKPVYVGDTLHFRMTITNCRRTSTPDEGVVGRHVRLVNQRDETVQEGTTRVLVKCRAPGMDCAHLAVGTQLWAERLSGLLGADPAFTAAVATWDGAVGLRCDDREVHLRIYKGAVIDVTRRAPRGATFTVAADELTWADIITGEDNDFMRQAIRGRFKVTGDGYEYLRLTKALTLICDHARRLASEGGSTCPA